MEAARCRLPPPGFSDYLDTPPTAVGLPVPELFQRRCGQRHLSGGSRSSGAHGRCEIGDRPDGCLRHRDSGPAVESRAIKANDATSAAMMRFFIAIFAIGETYLSDVDRPVSDQAPVRPGSSHGYQNLSPSTCNGQSFPHPASQMRQFFVYSYGSVSITGSGTFSTRGPTIQGAFPTSHRRGPPGARSSTDRRRTRSARS